MKANGCLIAILASVTLYCCAYLIYQQATLPIVLVSNSSGECVAVIPEGSCDEMPDFYSREWVQ